MILVINILLSLVVVCYICLYLIEYYMFCSLCFDVIGCEVNGKLNIM